MSDKGKIAKATAVITATATVVRFYTEYKAKWDERHTHSLTLEEGSYVFMPMMKWLHDNVPNARHGKVKTDSYTISTVHNASKKIEFELDGYKIELEGSEEKPKVETNEYGELDIAKKTITFSSSTADGIKAVEKLLAELHAEKRASGKESIHSYNCTSFGWSGRVLPMRYLDMVFLPRGQKEEILSDIENFMSNEEEYAKIGAPWHRGYLLYGPPGNGKTSLVQSLAHYYSRDLYSLSLATVKTDAELTERMSQMTNKSFLLLEDLDIFGATVTRGKKKDGVTLAGLLNALDGINTPHGLITFMTTNAKENLDSALVRHGRCDLHVELTTPGRFQVEEMFSAVYDESLGVKARDFNSMAEYADVLKRHIGDAETARLEIKRGDA